MSKKRSPAPLRMAKRGSFGPVSGFQPIRLMWSASATSWPTLVALLDAARGIGQHHRRDAQRAQHAHRKGDLLRRVALVEVHAALHHDHRHAAERPATMRPECPSTVDCGKCGISR